MKLFVFSGIYRISIAAETEEEALQKFTEGKFEPEQIELAEDFDIFEDDVSEGA